MANTILFKRGPEATIPVAQAGEMLFTTDTKKYVVGDGTVNHEMVTLDYSQILTNKTIDTATNTITNLTDSNFSATAAIDATKIANGTVTNTEFQYIGGLTSDAQTQLTNNASAISDHLSDTIGAHTGSAITNVPSGNLVATDIQGAVDELQTDVDSRIPNTEKAAANGVATLDAGGKVPSSQLPNSVMEYKGNFDASTNTPALDALTPNNGDVYRVSVAGSQAYIESSIALAVGDFVIYNGTIWEKSINSNEVVSVNGYKGVVVLAKSDVGLGNVDNTADIDKPVSTAQATAIGVVQTNLDNHILDTIDAHDASAISTNSVAFTGILTATEDDVQKALAKLSSSSVALITQDIQLTQFSLADSQAVAADITGFYFNPATVRSFEALVSVSIDATTPLFESFKIHGLNAPSGFVIAIDSIGDDSGVWFDVTNLGQVQYTSSTYSGFVSGTMSFRAIITKI